MSTILLSPWVRSLLQWINLRILSIASSSSASRGTNRQQLTRAALSNSLSSLHVHTNCRYLGKNKKGSVAIPK